MATMRELLRRVWGTMRGYRVDADLEAELQSHLAMAEDELRRAGHPPAEAARLARLRVGQVPQAMEAARDQRGLRWLSDVSRDARFGVRALGRTPLFTCVVLAVLAVGIGANTAAFSALRAASLGGSAFPEPDRLAVVWTTPQNQPDAFEGPRIIEYFAWAERARSFEALGALLPWQSTLGAMRDGEPAERLNGWRMGAATFRAVGVEPQLGRWLSDFEDRLDAPLDVVVISDALWERLFERDPGVLGETLVLDDQTATIIGVMPPGFALLDIPGDFWLPLATTTFQLESRSPNRVLLALGRLAPGVSHAQAATEIAAINDDVARDDAAPVLGRGARVVPYETALFAEVRNLLRLLQGAVAFVLLIACANVAGLLLLRALSREREVAIRGALGASRGQLVRLFLVQGVVLSLAGGGLGVLLAWAGVGVATGLGPAWLGPVNAIGLDGGVLAFTLGLSVLTGVAFAVAPAISLARRPGDLRAGPSTGSRRQRRLQQALVGAQITLTLVLLVGAGLLGRTFWNLQQVDLGFEPREVLYFEARLPANAYFRQVGMENGFSQLEVSPVPSETFARLRARLERVPGVLAASGTNAPPGLSVFAQAPFRVEGQEGPTGGAGGASSSFRTNDDDFFADYALITPGYFEAAGIPVVRGRAFTDTDARGAEPVAIVNEAFARRFLPDADPLGESVTVAIVSGESPRRIVGVVGDTRMRHTQTVPSPALYVPQLQESLRSRVPYGQSRVNMAFLVRLDRPAETVVPEVRRVVADVDASMPVDNLRMMDEFVAEQLGTPRNSMLLAGGFAAVALLLAAIGIYGMVAYGVAQRTREIGVRMALGASRRRILGAVLREGLGLAVAALLIGLAVAAALSRYLTDRLFDLAPLDPATFVVAPLVLLAAVVAACAGPARRATRVDPQSVLRCD